MPKKTDQEVQWAIKTSPRQNSGKVSIRVWLWNKFKSHGAPLNLLFKKLERILDKFESG